MSPHASQITLLLIAVFLFLVKAGDDHDKDWWLGCHNGGSRSCPFRVGTYKYYNDTSNPCGDTCYKWQWPKTSCILVSALDYQISVYNDTKCQTLVDHPYAVAGPWPRPYPTDGPFIGAPVPCIKLSEYDFYDEGSFKVTCVKDAPANPNPTPPPGQSPAPIPSPAPVLGQEKSHGNGWLHTEDDFRVNGVGTTQIPVALSSDEPDQRPSPAPSPAVAELQILPPPHEERKWSWNLAYYNGTSHLCPYAPGDSLISYKKFNQSTSPCGNQCHKWDGHPHTGCVRVQPFDYQISLFQDVNCQTLVDHPDAVFEPDPPDAKFHPMGCVKLHDYEGVDEGSFKVTCPEDLPSPSPTPPPVTGGSAILDADLESPWWVAYWNGTSRDCPYPLIPPPWHYRVYNQTSAPCGKQCHKWEWAHTTSIKARTQDHQISFYQDANCQTLVDDEDAVFGPVDTSSLTCVKLDDYDTFDEGSFKVTCPEDIPKPTPPAAKMNLGSDFQGARLQAQSDAMVMNKQMTEGTVDARKTVQGAVSAAAIVSRSAVTSIEKVDAAIAAPTTGGPTDVHALDTTVENTFNEDPAQFLDPVDEDSVVAKLDSTRVSTDYPKAEWVIFIRTFSCCTFIHGYVPDGIYNNTNWESGRCGTFLRRTSAYVYAGKCTVRFFRDLECTVLMNEKFGVITPGEEDHCVHLTLDPAKQDSSTCCECSTPKGGYESWHFNGSFIVDCPK